MTFRWLGCARTSQCHAQQSDTSCQGGTGGVSQPLEQSLPALNRSMSALGVDSTTFSPSTGPSVHWHSTVLHDEGVPIKVARERLSHSRAETTMKHYVHLSQQADVEAANAVSRRLRLLLRSHRRRILLAGLLAEMRRLARK